MHTFRIYVYLSGHTSQNAWILFLKLSVWQGGRGQWEGPLVLSVTCLHSVQCKVYWYTGPTVTECLLYVGHFPRALYQLTHLTFTTTLWGRLLLSSFFPQMRILRCPGVLFLRWCSRWQSWDTDPSRKPAVSGLNSMETPLTPFIWVQHCSLQRAGPVIYSHLGLEEAALTAFVLKCS